MNVWSGVISLCLYHLSVGFMINPDSNIGLVIGPTESSNADVTADSQRRSQSSILESVGQGIGGLVSSWLGPLASGVGSVLGGISSSLVTMTTGGLVSSPNNAVTELFSDVTPTADDNEGSDEKPTPDKPADDYQYETGETESLTIRTLEPLASL